MQKQTTQLYNHKQMYVNPEIIIPNYFQLDELPYIKLDNLSSENNLTAKRMLSIRNMSYKYDFMMAKIFVFWPVSNVKPDKQQPCPFKISLLTEIPVMPLQNLTYIITELYQKKQLDQTEWNTLISLVEQFKNQSMKFVDYVFMADYQMKIGTSKNLLFNVYYSPTDDCFRLKVAFKMLSFEVSPFPNKNKLDVGKNQGFVIRSQALIETLRSKLNEKLGNYSKRYYQEQSQQKIKQKIVKFYERQIKQVDQNLLQLKLKVNYPILRQKAYLPIQFMDGFDDEPLVQPIISNKNQNCMYNHFTGYNSNNYNTLQNTYCKFCGIEIKEMQENKLMMFLRNNIFNPGNCSILYCPEFNRFKIMKRLTQAEIATRKLANLKLSDSKQEEMKENQNKIDEENNANQNTEMKNEEDIAQQSTTLASPETQIKYINYMHLCLTIKSTYPLTKNRIKTQPRKQVEYIQYLYELYPKKKEKQNKSIYQYFQKFQLMDPARGKFCTHLQFADLRMFYKSAQKKQNLFYSENVYICPICGDQIKDSQLIYLKQVLVLIKFIRKLMEPTAQDQVFQIKSQKRVDKSSIRIIINNVQKRVFIEYVEQDKGQIRKQWQEIEKFYSSLVDPYIHFSEYSLGLHKRSRKNNPLLNYGNVDPEQIIQKLENQWYGNQEGTSFIV